MSTSDEVRELIFRSVQDFLEDPDTLNTAISKLSVLPAEVQIALEAVLADNRISYRDGVLIQLAYGIVDPKLDLTRRPAGARSVAKKLGTFFADRHIRHVKDAYQNIAKNTEVLTRGNVPEFDELLQWTTSSTLQQREVAFLFACANAAASARPVSQMPPLNRSSLSFARVCDLLFGLLDTPSSGAFEQFTIAALLSALVTDKLAAHRVETKSLNASDRSSFAAGDVQIVTGNRVIEAFEVTANSWRSKLSDATKTIRDNDLSRLHVVANRPENERADAVEALGQLGEDVSVLDVRQMTEMLLASLTRPQRAEALNRLYEFLDRYQPDVGRVNLYVQKLEEAGLVESGSK